MKNKTPTHTYMILRILFLFLCTSVSNVVIGQKLEVGKWSGTIREENTIYQYEVNVRSVNGNNLEGITIASSKDFKCTSSFIGTVDNDSVVIIETRVLSTSYSNAQSVCLMSLRLYIDSANNIKGRFTSSNKNKSICGRGTVSLRMMKTPTSETSDEIESPKSIRIALSRADEIVKTSTVQKTTSIVLPDTKSILSGLRKGVLLEELLIPLDSIRVEVYDNGVVDGDVVSIVVNGVVQISKVKLSDKPLSFDLRSDGSKEYIIEFFAENLGEIPPNTGLMILKNSVFRKDVIFSSDFNSSSYIKIKLTGIPKD